MVEQISDDKFKSEVMKFIEVANQKFDGLTADVRTNGYRIDKLENEIDNLATGTNSRFDRIEKSIESIADSVGLMSKQFTSVVGKVIDNDQQLGDLESRVAVLEGEVH